MILRGLALPFTPRCIAGRFIELARPHAFNAMIKAGRRVPVFWQSHDAGAPVLAVSAMLFADEDHLKGLAFEVRVEPTVKNSIAMAAIVDGRCAACSVHFSSMRTSTAMVDGMRCRTIEEATISHVSILPAADAAYGELTATWRADDGARLEDAPYRIRDLNDRFDRGLAAHRAQNRREAAAATARARRLQPIAAYIAGDRSFRALASLASFKLQAPARRI